MAKHLVEAGVAVGQVPLVHEDDSQDEEDGKVEEGVDGEGSQ